MNHQENLLYAALILITLLFNVSLCGRAMQHFCPHLQEAFQGSMYCGNNVRSGHSGALCPISAVTAPMPTKAVQLSKKRWRHPPHSGKLLNVKEEASIH